MLQSLSRVILTASDDMRVLPGHGPETTIGRERATNPFLRALVQEQSVPARKTGL
jgi:glyoxylase-like metal-dependent hydrolase (beta-lactamase superfamily II)